MTTDTDKEALARRAVAAWQKCGLNWSPRMEFVDPKGCLRTVIEVDGGSILGLAADGREQWFRTLAEHEPPEPLDDVWPNLDDHATLGCIEHGMLPDAWGEGCLLSVKRWTTSDGTVMADVHVHEFTDACPMLFGVVDVPLAEALVACLEAAAERRKS